MAVDVHINKNLTMADYRHPRGAYKLFQGELCKALDQLDKLNDNLNLIFFIAVDFDIDLVKQNVTLYVWHLQSGQHFQ